MHPLLKWKASKKERPRPPRWYSNDSFTTFTARYCLTISRTDNFYENRLIAKNTENTVHLIKSEIF